MYLASPDNIRLLVSVFFGLLGGAGGGLLTARRMAILGLNAKEQYEAKAVVRSVVNSYGAQLRYDHDGVYRSDSFPARYAKPEGQAEFVESVLREFPKLSKRARNRLRAGLVELHGEIPLGLAEARLHLPGGYADDDERLRISTYMVKAAFEGELGKTRGLLAELLATQNDVSAHKEALEKTLGALDSMAESVRP
jgi:hypothetical protein